MNCSKSPLLVESWEDLENERISILKNLYFVIWLKILETCRDSQSPPPPLFGFIALHACLGQACYLETEIRHWNELNIENGIENVGFSGDIVSKDLEVRFKLIFTSMHSSRMRTAALPLYWGRVFRDRDPQTETPRTETPLERDTPVDRLTLLKTLHSRNFVCGR